VASSPAPDAAQRRRVWLDGRRRWDHDLVLVLLRYAPEADIAHALDQLAQGELHRLGRLLSQATDLRQVAHAIVADLYERLDGRPAGPASGQPSLPPATPMRS
jgi:hypothetical protein